MKRYFTFHVFASLILSVFAFAADNRCPDRLANLGNHQAGDYDDTFAKTRIRTPQVVAHKPGALKAAVQWAMWQELSLLPAIQAAVERRSPHAIHLIRAARFPESAQGLLESLRYSLRVSGFKHHQVVQERWAGNFLEFAIEKNNTDEGVVRELLQAGCTASPRTLAKVLKNPVLLATALNNSAVVLDEDFRLVWPGFTMNGDTATLRKLIESGWDPEEDQLIELLEKPELHDTLKKTVRRHLRRLPAYLYDDSRRVFDAVANYGPITLVDEIIETKELYKLRSAAATLVFRLADERDFERLSKVHAVSGSLMQASNKPRELLETMAKRLDLEMLEFLEKAFEPDLKRKLGLKIDVFERTLANTREDLFKVRNQGGPVGAKADAVLMWLSARLRPAN